MIRDKNHLLNSDRFFFFIKNWRQREFMKNYYRRSENKCFYIWDRLQSHIRSGIALFLLMVLHSKDHFSWLSYLLCLGSVRKTKIKKSSKKHAEIKALDVSQVIICLVCSTRFIMINWPMLLQLRGTISFPFL